MMASVRPKKFQSVMQAKGRGALVPIPFDPNDVWGPKDEHRVHGTINKRPFRGSIKRTGENFAMPVGPAWLRDCGVSTSEKIVVELKPEGPQREDLAPDIAKALRDDPEAGAFFDSLAQFYRKAYLKWVDSTKRSPEVRAERIAEMIMLLKAGTKERPRH